MPLTRVLHWVEGEGYQPIDIEQAVKIYPKTVSANSGIFVCSLCGHNVTLTSGTKNKRYFKHNRADEQKICEERSQIASANLARLGKEFLPKFKIDYSGDNYSLQIGFPLKRDIELSDFFSKICIQGIGLFDEKSKERIYNAKRMTEAVSYLDIDQKPFPEYTIRLVGMKEGTVSPWPEMINGIEKTGAFFHRSSKTMLGSGETAFLNVEYYLLFENLDGFIPKGIEWEKLVSPNKNRWTLYRVKANELTKETAHFFAKRSVILKKKNERMLQLWPPAFYSAESVVCKSQSIYIWSPGTENVSLHPYQTLAQLSKQRLGDGQLLYLSGVQENTYLTRGENRLIEKLEFKTEKSMREFPDVTIDVQDGKGKQLIESAYHSLPYMNRIYAISPVDGFYAVLKDGKVIRKDFLRANNRVTIDIDSLNTSIRFYAGNDLIQQLKFIKKENHGVVVHSKEDYFLLQTIKRMHGSSTVSSRRVQILILNLKKAFPVSTRYVQEKVKAGTLPETAVLYLERFLCSKVGGKKK